MLLTGNAYVAIRRKKGMPVELEEIPYANVQVILGDNNGDLTYQVSYNDERNSEVIRSDDMLHFVSLLPVIHFTNTLEHHHYRH